MGACSARDPASSEVQARARERPRCPSSPRRGPGHGCWCVSLHVRSSGFCAVSALFLRCFCAVSARLSALFRVSAQMSIRTRSACFCCGLSGLVRARTLMSARAATQSTRRCTAR
eukprot:2654581-Rhodomonas_salina.2